MSATSAAATQSEHLSGSRPADQATRPESKRPKRIRPRRPRLAVVPAPAPAPLARTAVIAASWAVGVAVTLAAMVTTIIWAVGGQSSATFDNAVRSGGLLYGVSHLVPIQIGGVDVTLLPIGLVIVPLLLCRRVGKWAANTAGVTTRGLEWSLVAAIATVYATLSMLVVVVCSTADAWVSPTRTAFASFAVAGVGSGFGVFRSASRAFRFPDQWRRIVATMVRQIVILVAASSLLLLVTLIAQRDAIIAMFIATAPSVGDRIALGALMLAFLPTLVIWVIVYASGAGVFIGATVVTPTVGATVVLPAVPLFAALPTAPLASGTWLLAPFVIAGVLGGLRQQPANLGAGLARAVLASMGSGIVIALLSVLASGGFGSGALAQIGPAPLRAGLTACVLLLVGALPAVGAAVLVQSPGGRWAREHVGVVRSPGYLRAHVTSLRERIRFSLYDDGA